MTDPSTTSATPVRVRHKRPRWRARQLLGWLPGFCPADLVSWALRSPGVHLWDCRQDDMCRSDSQRNGRCYCGKVRPR